MVNIIDFTYTALNIKYKLVFGHINDSSQTITFYNLIVLIIMT